MKYVTVVGLGYVGLPTAVHAAECGYVVNGVDLDENKINKIKNGNSYVESLSSARLRTLIANGNLHTFVKISEISNSDIYVICVPTPLDSNHTPDLRHLIAAIKNIGSQLKIGNLVIVESTVAPGTINGLVLDLLIRESNLNDKDFYLAYSPERIDPGNEDWTLTNTPKLVSGMNQKSKEIAINFYSKFISTLVPCDSIEIAESAKLLENTFRFINISFINELNKYFTAAGINIWDVINAASTKPYGFMPFYPSIGVGGHCIPVDPIYLSDKAKKIGVSTKFIDLADEVNRYVYKDYVSKASELIGELVGKRIMIVGIAYKPNVSDVRESPAIELIKELRGLGAEVNWHDDLVKVWRGTLSSPINNNCDLIIVNSLHDYLDLSKFSDVPILSAKNLHL